LKSRHHGDKDIVEGGRYENKVTANGKKRKIRAQNQNQKKKREKQKKEGRKSGKGRNN
jgi:hypothetical protein